MNRFYKDVSTGPAIGGGFAVLLDGRPVRTPQKSLMAAPTEQLARLVADEWAAQGEVISAQTMPVTQLLTTSIDHKSQRAAITAEVLQYLNSDLLCYRAGEPENLAAEQKRVWDPWLAWFGQKFRVVLETTFALTRLDQDKAAHEAVAKAVAALSDSEFTVLQAVVPLTGSIVLALALVDGALAPDEAFVCALCEELFYERIHDLERHGLDPTEERRRQALKRDLQAARDYLTATRS